MKYSAWMASADRAHAMTAEVAAVAVPNNPNLFHRALHIGVGDTPAEVLDPFDRRLLLLRLRHWPISDVAAHTGWSEYTVARMRDELAHLPLTA
ncbi:hypothetical protein OG579_16820 [Williamsia herbipolensis]|uniref:Uncharacterized protein n=1 Tax=Williamsia herbipolensis TaxID=1603258 RepID=A0AAU4JZY4_9NOCA|nr:hypothetical protein [Williamsia herbipolensis]